MNADEDHRCQRCGRRLMGTAVEAPPEHAIRALQAVGANALAAATAEMARPELPAPKEDKPKRSPNQPLLFGEEAGPKVIPFDRVARAAQNPAETAATAEMFPSNAAKPRAASKKPAAENAQAKLDFLPPAVQTTRVLKTTVEAAIYCDSPVATPMHRAMASALDAGVIAAAFASFLGIFVAFGGSVEWNKQTIPVFAGAFIFIALFYGFVWMLASTETAGMRWTELKLVTFNGFAPDRKTRALRMAGCFLSFCSGMIGILWALVDEEGLTWHDHMSKTFPTLRDTGSHLIRQ